VKQGIPSITAEAVTALRAAESLRPENERVCYDPLAREFVGTRFRLLVNSGFLRMVALWVVERLVPGLVGDIIGRVRYIDDYLRECITDGIDQLVILGAGYDSRAYRFDGLDGRVKVFEVDHPATQKVKMAKVKKIFGSLPGNVTYASIDFEREKLDRLFESGYDRNLKTCFIWEGVTMYLTPQAVDDTLTFVANNSGEGSSIIFDYLFKSFVDGTSEMEGVQRIEAVRKAYELLDEPLTDEPFTFGIEEGNIGEFLSQKGFWQIEEVTGEYLENAYFRGVGHNRRVLRLCGFVHATVKTR
jgi:methyltransferase (TIGR00027 family)